ncbi:MAG: DUF2163 domain-containing protein [Patescibacteria group bacterium]|nr:DUF2163 domain-containing protein [Patescibacteria group bacterium]
MKQISASMQALLESSGITALATFYLITRKDGVKLAFTDWQTNVTAGGVTYSAAPGHSRSSMQQRADLAAPNFEMTGIVTTGLIVDEDIRAGVYNSATIQVWMAVPTDTDFLTYGRIPLPGAYIGEIKLQDGIYVLEVRGYSYQLQQSYVEVYTPTCRADFCDHRCKLNASSYTATGAISAIATQRVNFTVAVSAYGDLVGPLSPPPFTYGVVTFTSGKNNKYSVEVSNASMSGYNLDINLYLPSPFPFTIGDTVSLLAGCDKTIATCADTYFNSVNFRGEPFIPGMSFLFDYGEAEP